MPAEDELADRFRHRINVTNTGTFYYNHEDELDREWGPAVKFTNGAEMWYRNGSLHRENGPAVELTSGNKMWYRNGNLHREGGPAVEFIDGHQEWWVNGERHRADGPAIVQTDGAQEWYLDGKELTEEEFIKQTQPATEPTVAEIECLLGKRVKIAE